jgi:hypothetical protein
MNYKLFQTQPFNSASDVEHALQYFDKLKYE